MSGFSPNVRLLIRRRAGNGFPEEARCEHDGRWLGEHGGQIQHIVARGMGGSRSRNGADNGALICGTSCDGCHGACERRDPVMRDRGFWRFSSDDPAKFPVRHILYGPVYLLPDGSVSPAGDRDDGPVLLSWGTR